jgi:hypothetical protein
LKKRCGIKRGLNIITRLRFSFEERGLYSLSPRERVRVREKKAILNNRLLNYLSRTQVNNNKKPRYGFP